MTTIDQYSPDRLADRMRIQDVMYKWCRAVDRLDCDAIVGLFHEDAHDAHGIYNGDIPGLVAWIRKRHVNIPFSMHQVSNMLIEFASETVALSETYLRTIQRYPKEGFPALAQLATGSDDGDAQFKDIWTCSRYLDRFERRNGGEWKIADRIVIQDWKLVTSMSTAPPQNVPGSVAGRRDADDALYVARRALGIGSA